jgi:endonuclease/exonuclease/phosphatase family metal-dependent hydrolase
VKVAMMTNRASTESVSANRITQTLAALLVPLLVSLFFLQALRLYFTEVYLVVWAALFSEPIDLSGLAVAALMLLSLLVPLTLPALRRATGVRTITLTSAIGISLVRLLLSAGLSFQMEAAAACVVVGLYGLFLPAYLEQFDPSRSTAGRRGYLVSGLGLALAYDMAIRALGTSVDLSRDKGWLVVQVILSAIAVLAIWLSRASTERDTSGPSLEPLSSWAGVLLLGGLGPLLFLEYNLFMHASTVSRWVQVDYDLMAILIPSATVIGLLIPRFKGLQSLGAVVVQNVVVLLSVSAFLWYDGWISGVLVLLGQVCVVLDLRLLFQVVRSHTFRWKTSTVVGVALCLSLMTAFLLTFLLTLSFAYAYTFDAFRGTEPLSFLIAAAVLGATALAATFTLRRAAPPPREVPWVRQSVAAVAVILALVGSGLQPEVNPEAASTGTLRLMTYNLHQSFGMDNKLDMDEIAATITQGDPDIIGLQEADAGRVPSLSVEEVLWLSRRLNMYSAYGPSWGDTYGVAVLSKYPIVAEQRYLLSSAEQQRSCLETTIDLGQQTVTFFSVHLGLNSEERERQLDEVLAYTARAPTPKVLVGDFNANPDSHEIERVLEQFTSTFAAAGMGTGYTSPADAPRETIDYVFVSPDLQVLSAEVISSLASDHLPVVAQLGTQTP